MLGFRVVADTGRRLDVDFMKDLDGDIREYTHRVAMGVLQEQVRRGFDRQPTVITDGVVRRDPRQVRAYGRIEFVAANSVVDVVRWALGELKRLSPVGSGRDPHPGLYSFSHIVMINGESVDETRLEEALRGVREVRIVNVQPYAGKIESKDAYVRYQLRTPRGKRNRRKWRKAQGATAASMRGQSSQAPNGVYRVVARKAPQRFGRSVRIEFRPEALNLGVLVASKNRKGERTRHRAQIYPTLRISLPR